MQPGIVTSDKLRRMKCPICGSREKNVAEYPDSSEHPILKILACNQCGYITMFGVAAAAVTDILVGGSKGVEYYECLVREQHEGNHPN